MFQKGRPKNHKHAAYITYDAHDGTRITYEMTTKGPLTRVNDIDLIRQNLSKNIQDNAQTQPSIDVQYQSSELPVSSENPEISFKSSNTNIDEINNFSNDTFQNIEPANNYAEIYACDEQLNYSYFDDEDFNNHYYAHDDTPLLTTSSITTDLSNIIIYQDSENDGSKIDFNNKDIFDF